HRLPGLELENAVQSSARRAPDGDAPPTTAALHGDGLPLVAVRTDKDLAIRIEAFHGQRAGKVRLRLLERPEADRVIDDTVHLAHAARVQDVLEVEGILHHVPEAPLHVTEQPETARPVPAVGDGELPDLGALTDGYESADGGFDAAVLRREAGRSGSVGANVLGLRAQGFGYRLPAHRPVVAVFFVPQVKIAAGTIHGHAVEAEAQQPARLGRMMKGISRRVVRD